MKREVEARVLQENVVGRPKWTCLISWRPQPNNLVEISISEIKKKDNRVYQNEADNKLVPLACIWLAPGTHDLQRKGELGRNIHQTRHSHDHTHINHFFTHFVSVPHFETASTLYLHIPSLYSFLYCISSRCRRVSYIEFLAQLLTFRPTVARRSNRIHVEYHC